MENAFILVAHNVTQRVATFRVIHGGKHLTGLVQSQGNVIWVDPDSGTIHANLLLMRVDAGAEFGNKFAIDLNTTFGDHILALAAGTEARLSKQLLQSNGIGIIIRASGAGICVWHRSPNVAGQFERYCQF